MAESKNDYDFFSDDLDSTIDNIEQSNPYLENPAQGIELLSNLLPKHRQLKKTRQQLLHKLDSLIDKELPRALRGLTGINVLETAGRLQKISDQLLERQQIPALAGKIIVGVGGKFSAGKSCFINSRLAGLGEEFLLPENQNATTSIPTYIVKGTQYNIVAGLTDGREIQLSSEAMQAMTHAFYQTYGIGFSRFVNTLVLATPAFDGVFADKIALLDTPGYNKTESTDTEGRTDEKIALTELRAADFLIWLIHIDNGTITMGDLSILENLAPQQKPLIIFTHADEKTEGQQKAVVEAGKQALDEAGLPYFDVVAYSSLDAEEMLGTDSISDFFRQAGEFAAKQHGLPQELNELAQAIRTAIRSQERKLEVDCEQLEQEIHRVEDVRFILSLTELYRGKKRELVHLRQRKYQFVRVYDQIREIFNSL